MIVCFVVVILLPILKKKKFYCFVEIDIVEYMGDPVLLCWQLA